MQRTGRMLVLGLIFALLPAASAQATDRYVDANTGVGDANAGCTIAPSGDGCTLDNGITAAGPGDRVFMAAGTYAFTPGSGVQIADAGLELIGAGSPQTTITTTATGFASLYINAAGVKVSGLRIVDSSTNGNAIQLTGAGVSSVIERVSAITSGYAACLVQAGGTTTIRDSVCANVGSGGSTPAIQASSGPAQDLLLTNVTAYAAAMNGLALYASVPSGQDTTVTARNSIFRAPAGTDIFTSSTAVGDVAAVSADYSDYATVSPANDAQHDVTLAGSSNNIVASPVFADTDTNFRQAAGSPTIDEGSAGVLATPFLDIDGSARTVGSAPDIGADEFVPPPVTRYVAPGAPETGDCTTLATQCDFDYGVAQAGDGDTVQVAPGDYTEADTIEVFEPNVHITGPGVGQATLTTSGTWGLQLSAPNATVSGFRIVQTAGGTSGLMFNANSGGSVAEQMSITTGGSSTCRDNADGTVTIRDSVCVFTGSGFGAVLASSGDNQILNVRNVTAVSTSDGMPGVAVYGKDAQNTVVNVRNSIISGGGTTEDVHVQSLVTSGSNTVDLDYSDYDLASVPGVDTIVTEGLHNVSAAPLFTDTDVFFHQAGGYIPSPTIDKGSAAFTTGSLGDIDGGARSLGSAPDIGADEFVPAPTVTPTPPGPTAAAATGQRAAALKKCKKKKGAARKKCKKKALKLPV